MKSISKQIPGLTLLLLLILFLIYSIGTSVKEVFTSPFSFKLLMTDTFHSFTRVAVFTLAAWLSGILSAYILHHSSLISQLLISSINFIRHISPFAWLPFAIIWFGLGEAPVGFILFITLYFPTLIAALGILTKIPREYLEEAQVLGAGNFQIFLRIELPVAWQEFLNTFRLIWGLGWATIIAVEMLGVSNGLGFRLLDFRYLMNYSAMIIYILVMGFIGIITDLLLRKLINRVELLSK